MRLHHLNALAAIADSGSFTAAAKRLRISQSSLSHAISDLEEELNLCLLERSRQGARPSEAGRRILAHARQALASVESIRAEARSSAGQLFGRVRIGSIPSTAIAFLPKVIGHFSRVHPNVEVLLLEEPSQGMEQLVDWLMSAVIDIAIMELPVPDLNVVPFLRDELCAIVASSSPAARASHLSIKELAQQSFIMSRYNSERLIRAAYSKHKLAANVRFEVHDLGTLVSLVREGLGISIVPRISFPSVPDGVALVPLRPAVKRELGFVMPLHGRRSTELQAFVEQARELSPARSRLR